MVLIVGVIHKIFPNLHLRNSRSFTASITIPSSARIWFYGDDDPNERLRVLNDTFDASSAPSESKIHPQKLFSEPVRIVEKYPAAEGADLKKKHMVCLNWLLDDKPLDLETELALGFLDHLMLGTPASPLRKILLESGLGDAIVGGGVEDELHQPKFSIGLKGVSEDDIKKVEELIMNSLRNLAEEGFDSDAVEASMNTIEFSLRENNTGLVPRGLALMLRSIGKLVYNMDPFEPLKYQKPLMDLKSRITEEGSKAVFAPLLEKFNLKNPHLVTIEMQRRLLEMKRLREREILNKAKASMTEEDLAELARATQELRLKQETPDPPEALKTVPSLSLSDIPKNPTFAPIEVGDINGVKILQHDLFTNYVLFAEVVFNMSSLKQELLPFVPLFWRAPHCASRLKSLRLAHSASTWVRHNHFDEARASCASHAYAPCAPRAPHAIFISARRRNSDLIVVNCILQDVQFTDQKWFKQFVSQSKARIETRLRGSGHGIAAVRMDAKLNVAGWISEQMGGVNYLEFLQSLEKKVGEDWDGISSSLEEIRSTSPIQSASWNARLRSTNDAIVIPTQVNYVGKAANIYDTGYELKGSSYVISKHISNTWLWDRVRVSGGAYGGFCDFDTHSGIFSFLSYRDPNLLKTLDVYDATGDFLRELEMDNDTLTKAIIGTIGDVDACQLPDAKGYSSLLRYMLGVTEEERQKRREEILSTSLHDFKEFADAIDAIKDKGLVVAVASPDDVEAANKEHSNFLEVKKVL
ncbi:presequence protease 2 [Actinidia rufa]|uniref:Presequence protease 2 n=1 Tax=Actinidia rufa TaxID=165716 RepID=A0A7J0DRE6_9ERIC|nr:presequence protease 2 [Actinidia rufa]